MTTNTATLSRIDALETYFGGRCPVCEGWPTTRVVTTDSTTRQETGETRPAICPRCGAEPTAGHLEIIGIDIDDLP